MFQLPSLIASFAVAVAFLGLPHDGLADTESRFLSNTRQLIFEGKRSGEGYFDPAGRRLVFQSEREEGNPFYQIYTLDLTSGDSTRVSPGIGKTTCGWFIGGTGRILFASTHLDPDAVAKQKAELDFRASGKERRYSWDYDPAYELFSANADGSDLKRLTEAPGYDAEGAASPDGKQIVFSSNRAAFPLDRLSPEERARFDRDPAYFADLYLMNADGTGLRRLTDAPGYDGGPFFSPDGGSIVWRRFDEKGMNADIFTMQLDSGATRRVTDFGSMSWAPFFHPSGKYLIFTSNKLGFTNFELFIVDSQGEREPVRVTFTDGFDGLPVFSPDGTRLVWTSGRTSDGKSQLFLADWSHASALTALENAPRRAVVQAPSPNVPAADASALPEKLDPLRERLGVLAAEAFAPTPLRIYSEAITQEDMRDQVAWLANPTREGRATGSPGAAAAADWAADYFRRAGLQPVSGSFFAPFTFPAGERLLPGANRLSVLLPTAGETEAKLDEDFRPLAFSENAEVEGEVVFAGYGLSVPEAAGQARYNSYDGLNVKDKVVLLLRYCPEGVEPPRRAHLNRYAGVRYKAMMARERGARAVLIVAGPNSPRAGELMPLEVDRDNASAGVVVASVSGAFADRLLASAGKTLKSLQTGLDQENPHAEGAVELPGVRVRVNTGIERIQRSDRNVLAAIPGADGAATKEWIMVGAHYDHLGRGGSGSLAKSGEEKQVHPGADDNASGVSVVMELAAALAAERDAAPGAWKRGLVFALWSGEEMGLLGSSAFAEKSPLPLEQIAAYVNFDMVGRLRENKLQVQGVGSSPVWKRLVEKRNVATGFSINLMDDPYLPTDSTTFYPRGKAVLNFFTGAHEDYHRPSDTADKLDYAGMQRIALLARGILVDLVKADVPPAYARVERKEASGASRDSLRAYLGSIPDYAQNESGVKLSGVRSASPAEKAGLRSGDVIVEFAGQKITGIYDYTYALDSVKIGVPVTMKVKRDGTEVTLTVTPESRK